MGAARRALQDSPFPEQDRLKLRSALEKKVERAKESLDRGKITPAKNGAYIKALIRLNEFLMEEKALMLLSANLKQRD